MRKRIDNVQCLLTATSNILLREGQYFCRLNNSWEIWGRKGNTGTVRCLNRIPDKQVLWVIKKPEGEKACTV
ncbi:MAG: hypothetical protein AB9866_01725 [Syntrophobacteraceae bacterium]